MAPTPRFHLEVAAPIPRIRIRLLKADIQDVGQAGTDGEIAVDAIAVGHYIGVKPVAAEKALDWAISSKLYSKVERPVRQMTTCWHAVHRTRHYPWGIGAAIFSRRSAHQGRQGQCRARLAHRHRRHGLCGAIRHPELAVLARELCWSLGRLGKRHLGNGLDWIGNGNLSARDAVIAWLEGANGRSAAPRTMLDAIWR